MKALSKISEKMRYNLNDFWPVFIAAHLDRRNQLLHCFGTVFMFSNFGLFSLTGRWLFVVLAFCGYLPSWIGHLVFEKNIPPTLQNPVIAGLCELKMVAFVVSGELKNELFRLFGTAQPSSGSPVIISLQEERAYQEALRFRVRAGINGASFEGNYWKIFLMKHQSILCVGMHVLAMVYFYLLLAYVVWSRKVQLLVLIPLTQVLGLLSHAFFERNHIDFEDAVFSPRAFGCLNRMLILFFSGRYFKEARQVAKEFYEKT